VKTVVLTFLLVAVAGGGCLSKEPSTNKNSGYIATIGIAATNREFFQVNAESPAERRQGEERLYKAFIQWSMNNANQQDRDLVEGFVQCNSVVWTGNSTQAEFEMYCKTAETLIADFADAGKRNDEDNKRFLRFLLQKMTFGNYYVKERWEPLKKQLRDRQKW
jgi:hypothetical protein